MTHRMSSLLPPLARRRTMLTQPYMALGARISSSRLLCQTLYNIMRLQSPVASHAPPDCHT